MIIEPSARIYALWENENAYTDSLGTLQTARTFETGRGSGGMKMGYPLRLVEHRERYALCRTLLGVFDVTAVDIAGNRECSLILAHRGQFGLDRLCAHAATVSAVKDLEQYLNKS
jgi:hypothetical protein